MSHLHLSPQDMERFLHKSEVVQGATSIFDALRDATRFQILSALLLQPRTVTELHNLVDVSQSAVSHQLRLLRDRKLVSFVREGQHVIYSLSDEHVAHLIEIALTHAAEPYEED